MTNEMLVSVRWVRMGKEELVVNVGLIKKKIEEWKVNREGKIKK